MSDKNIHAVAGVILLSLSASTIVHAFYCHELHQSGFFRHPSNCRAFYQCNKDGTEVLRYCATGMNWRVTGLGLGYCDIEGNSLCITNTENDKSSTSDTVIFNCPKDAFHKPIDGNFPNSRDCSRFFLCIDGQSYEMMCPYGFQWSISVGYCDIPYRANCVADQFDFRVEHTENGRDSVARNYYGNGKQGKYSLYTGTANGNNPDISYFDNNNQRNVNDNLDKILEIVKIDAENKRGVMAKNKSKITHVEEKMHDFVVDDNIDEYGNGSFGPIDYDGNIVYDDIIIIESSEHDFTESAHVDGIRIGNQERGDPLLATFANTDDEKLYYDGLNLNKDGLVEVSDVDRVYDLNENYNPNKLDPALKYETSSKFLDNHYIIEISNIEELLPTTDAMSYSKQEPELEDEKENIAISKYNSLNTEYDGSGSLE